MTASPVLGQLPTHTNHLDFIMHRAFAIVGILFLSASVAFADEKLDIINEAQTQIAHFHDGAETAGNKIHVVYFYAKDKEPLSAWRERLTRTLDDISEFYRHGLAQFGLKDSKIIFEKDADGYVIHLVRGELPSAEYHHSSGNRVEREIRKALGEKIEFDRAHVLAIHGLCRKEKDGRYVFHAP